ncbi:MAG: DUF2207 domain-containing protein [Clostridia bacterium]|nr:DUF2207 domain-containing protein [Clostridia bacterium]
MKKENKKCLQIILILWIISNIIILPFFEEKVDMKIKLSIMILVTLTFIVFFINENLIKSLKKSFYINKNVKKIEYYRDCLDEISPLMSAKLMGKNVFDKDAITAMILYLKDKNIIVQNDENKFIMNNQKDIRDHERFFIERSKFIFYDLYNRKETRYNAEYTVIQYLEKLVVEDLIKEELIDDNYKMERHISMGDAMPFLYFMANIFLLSGFVEIVNPNAILIIKIISMIAALIWISVYLLDIKFNISFKSYMTTKGCDNAVKLNALKRYLKKYSLISKRTIDEENLWGYYIRAAILFNLKGKLDKEATEYYNKIITMYDYNDNYDNFIDKILNVIVYVFCYGIWIYAFFAGDTLSKLILANFLIWPSIYMYLIRKKYKLLKKNDKKEFE